MAHYLLLAHQTATSPLLLQRLREIANGDAEASFTILVPETHVQHAFVCDEVETRAAALRRAAVAHAVLNTAGIRVARTEIGCADPLAAVEDELRTHAGVYDAIVLSTFAPGVSHWLHIDLPSRLTAQHELPVFHVYPGGDLVWAATDPVRRIVARGNRRKPVSRPDLPESPVFESPRDLASIVTLLFIFLVLGAGLALQYSRTFFMSVGLTIGFVSMLVFVLWLSDPVRRPSH